MPYYYLHELNHAMLTPARLATNLARFSLKSPLNPLFDSALARSLTASLEMFERVTRRYAKPEFGLSTTRIDGEPVDIEEKIVWKAPFCRLLHFERELSPAQRGKHPSRLLIVAPMSGHYATLLRGTVESLLPHHDIYITDWSDARMVPLSKGRFDLDDYIDYVMRMLRFLGPQTHVMAVCQPSVPVLAAISLMAEDDDTACPASMTLMGGPIDTRENPTAVNTLAQDRGTEWFAKNVIMKVPFPHAGFMRDVYPGFLQLSGFMGMNLDRHVIAHYDMFMHLVEGDGDSAEKHRAFYDEYLAVMDLTAEFYLHTVDTVFVRHKLPDGTMNWRGRRINPAAIKKTALFTIEGENDDISGVGQTRAAHKLCRSLATSAKQHYQQAGVGHYGVFNGSRYKNEIAPRITEFIRTHNR